MLRKSPLDLIRQVSTNLPADMTEALLQARNTEAKSSRGELALSVVLKNIELAKKQKVPICQDTGFPTFFVRAEVSKWGEIEEAIFTAVREATQKGLLRPNAVDPLSGKNTGDNTGTGFPKVHFENSNSEKTTIELILKGGGSENVSAQLSLPIKTDLGLAKRDLAGVQKAVLQIVKDAEGKGCAPGIISVVIGGERSSAYALAKKNLLRKVGEENPDSELKKLETGILHAANELKIGPLGLGGKTTLLDCRVVALHRHPASFFVTVAYSCWAARRGRVVLDDRGEIIENDFTKSVLSEELQLGKVKKLQLPVSATEVRKLKVGDVVSVSGKIFTGRDRVHERALKQKLPKDLKDSAIYHCGPVAIQKGNKWEFLAAGPTTSARLESFTPEFLEKTGVRVLIGKGGMGDRTARALKKFGGIYLHAIGGAAAFYADSVEKVWGVDFLEEFGVPEALWEIEVEDFLAVVGMDSSGGKL